MGAKPRVVVAMSGGVDSSLTAALLVHQGYDVIGVTMQIWENDLPEIDPEHRGCCSLSAVNDARRVADKLGIPYYVLNFREMFQETVVDYFIREYAAGKTPNPCIACNRYVKFEGLLQKALALDAQYVATGHYARIEYDKGRGRYILRKGVDRTKDQSYALYHLNQHTLRHFLMPLGEYTKVQTRQMARQFGLAVAEKPDSQEICFIPNDDYKSFLEEKAPETLRPGNIVDTHGRILGRHKGLPLYTVGQRKGLGIAVGKPLYVVALDYERNEVIVGSDEDVFASELIAEDLNFITVDKLASPLRVAAKIRYSAREAPATITPEREGAVYVRFDEPQRAITPGQSVVFYDGDTVVGGGIIRKAIR
ncbi:tRNA (5-methylaminomethyl-2-thiouridylate)-methyltransferase [Thermosinus carboxydivorans Nor1]|uniref:tRNA-specific 2-thiouridylase MnmA n=1 Tax=Thermosinus carboxydivorans Nor1 TaxID=401526 RepID=A1HU94_9FIRM|nr:tRNA 2-thiouridine(34) synthase MnmA [Thermosinus carboxydivorans]EAX46402.1 tRNA (5-methylaminomethyl-2-thiouridylate)-methyltransferase [Thermosinus carboxydivorans Nor1]